MNQRRHDVLRVHVGVARIELASGQNVDVDFLERKVLQRQRDMLVDLTGEWGRQRGDIGDLDDLFGGIFGARGRGSRWGPMPGADLGLAGLVALFGLPMLNLIGLAATVVVFVILIAYAAGF